MAKMREISLNSALVRILKKTSDGDGRSTLQPVGAGFLVSDRHFLTCAHVVAGELGKPDYQKQMPEGTVYIDFPLIVKRPSMKVKVVKWRPVKENAVKGDIEDIAVLELLPEAAHSAQITDIEVDQFVEFPVKMFGFPKGMDAGDWRNGTATGPIGDGLIQIDFDPAHRTAAPGFSGAPVCDKRKLWYDR